MLQLIAVYRVLIVMLGESYSYWLGFWTYPGWLSLLFLHAIIAIFLCLLLPDIRRKLTFSGLALSYFKPSAFVLIGSLVIAFLWQEPARIDHLNGRYALASISLIPVAEEIVFRGGLTKFFERFQSGIWPSYFSALVFAVAHTSPTWQRLINLELGLPLGAFFLGLSCEFLTRKSQSLIPAIAFHCVCNSTVLIFSNWAPSWLDRLSALYLG